MTETTKIIRSRICCLGKTNVDVISELKRRGCPIKLNPSIFSRAISNPYEKPSYEKVYSMTLAILRDWEAEAKKK